MPTKPCAVLRFRNLRRLAASAFAMFLASAGARAEAPSDLNIIEFQTLVRGPKGVVRCGLFGRAGWLTRTVQPAVASIHGDSALCVFHRIPPGTYGLSAFHDENNNGKLDTNWLGMPTEDYCASRNARGVLGPPSFDDARFEYHGATLRLLAQMK